MKKAHLLMLLIHMIFFVFVLLFAGIAFASVTPPQGPVSLYVVDDPTSEGIGTMVVQASLVDLYPSNGLSALLQYSWDDSVYMDWPGTDLVVFPMGKFKRTNFRLQLFKDGNEIGHNTDGIIIWPTVPEGTYHGLNAYSYAMIDWGDFQFQFLCSNSNNNFAPILIPPGALLLGAGIIGLIGSRRYVFKQ